MEGGCSKYRLQLSKKFTLDHRARTYYSANDFVVRKNSFILLGSDRFRVKCSANFMQEIVFNQSFMVNRFDLNSENEIWLTS